MHQTQSNYLKRGSHNAICMRCNRKVKGPDEIRPEWTGILVCSKCYDPRHPWTLPLPIAIDSLPVPNALPRPKDIFITGVLQGLTIIGTQYELDVGLGSIVPDIQTNLWHHVIGGVGALTFQHGDI